MKPECYKIEWEGDPMPLTEMFPDDDPDEHFLILKHFDKDEGCNILSGFHFNDRAIWKQLENEQLDTYYMNLLHAELNAPIVAKDYFKARADFRRMQKQREKKQLTKRL